LSERAPRQTTRVAGRRQRPVGFARQRSGSGARGCSATSSHAGVISCRYREGAQAARRVGNAAIGTLAVRRVGAPDAIP
jgi:hypothetical protein